MDHWKAFNQWKAKKCGWTSRFFLELRCSHIPGGSQESKNNRIGSTEQQHVPGDCDVASGPPIYHTICYPYFLVREEWKMPCFRICGNNNLIDITFSRDIPFHVYWQLMTSHVLCETQANWIMLSNVKILLKIQSDVTSCPLASKWANRVKVIIIQVNIIKKNNITWNPYFSNKIGTKFDNYFWKRGWFGGF